MINCEYLLYLIKNRLPILETICIKIDFASFYGNFSLLGKGSYAEVLLAEKLNSN